MPVEAHHVLAIGLGHGLLRLAHRQVIADAVGIAFLRLFESLIGQLNARLRHLNQLLRRGDVEQRVAHVGFHLRVLVAQLRLRRIQLRLRLLRQAAQGEFLENRHAQRRRRIHRAVRVGQRRADVAVIGVCLNGWQPRRCRRLALFGRCRGFLHQRRQVLAIGLGLLHQLFRIQIVEGRVGRLVRQM